MRPRHVKAHKDAQALHAQHMLDMIQTDHVRFLLSDYNVRNNIDGCSQHEPNEDS